jgi:hypothetical protein
MAVIIMTEDVMNRVGDDDARTDDLFRIARKEAVRVSVRPIASIAFTIAFTRTK